LTNVKIYAKKVALSFKLMKIMI